MKEYIPREDALYALDQNTVDCNPDHFAINTRDGFGQWSHDSGWNGGITAAKCTIKAIPAADVVPVVHAEWKVTDAYPHRVYCGHCFLTYAQEQWTVWKDGTLPRKYCPNCGAIMDGGTQDA